MYYFCLQVLYYIVGEGKCDRLFELVDLAIEHYRTQLSLHSLPLLRESDKQHESLLRFPGNVHYITSSDQLVISDSSHHRLLIVDAGSGVVQVVSLMMFRFQHLNLIL